MKKMWVPTIKPIGNVGSSSATYKHIQCPFFLQCNEIHTLNTSYIKFVKSIQQQYLIEEKYKSYITRIQTVLYPGMGKRKKKERGGRKIQNYYWTNVSLVIQVLGPKVVTSKAQLHQNKHLCFTCLVHFVFHVLVVFLFVRCVQIKMFNRGRESY